MFICIYFLAVLHWSQGKSVQSGCCGNYARYYVCYGSAANIADTVCIVVFESYIIEHTL